MRLFIGVWPDEHVAAAVGDYKRKLARGASGVKWVRDGNEHFTIRFLGETPRERAGAIESALERAARRTRAFVAKVEGPVLFPSPQRPRVIAVGLTAGAEEMRRLFDAIEDELEGERFERESRPFKAHMTLGRVKKRSARVEVHPPEEAFGEMLVDEVRLVESVLSDSGPAYAPVVRARLTEEG